MPVNFPAFRRTIAGLLLGPFCTLAAAPVAAQQHDPFGLAFDDRLTVPRSQILRGAAKDGIPALTEPRFIPAAEADWLPDGERVLGIEHNGVAKAYPTAILLWHEAVNDTIGGKPYLVTY